MTAVVLFLMGEKGRAVLQAAIESLRPGSVRLVVIGTDPNLAEDGAAALSDICRTQGLPHCGRQEAARIAACAPGAVAIAAGWRWLIRDPFLQTIVLHDSLLPRYRGYNPLVTALLGRDPESGVTAFIADVRIDAGDIVGCERIPLGADITIAEATRRMAEACHALACRVFRALGQGVPLVGTPQDEAEATYSVWRDEADYRIDWTRSAEDIAHFVRCLSFPYRGASTLWEGQLLRIIEARPQDDLRIANRDSGKVLFVTDGKPVVICGQGLLQIDRAVDADGGDALPFGKFRVRLT